MKKKKKKKKEHFLIFYWGCHVKQAWWKKTKQKNKEEHDYRSTVRVLTQNEIHNFQICFQYLFAFLLLTVKLCDSFRIKKNELVFLFSHHAVTFFFLFPAPWPILHLTMLQQPKRAGMSRTTKIPGLDSYLDSYYI